MTLGDALGLTDARERLLVRGMQAALLGLSLYGLATGQLRLTVNGLLALSVTLLPAVLRREYHYNMDAGLVLWLTLAVVLHALGFLGFYDRFSWYDNVTHAVSSAFVAGVGYATFRAFELHSEEIDVPSVFRAVFVVVFALAFGVVWEVLEFAAIELSRLVGTQSPVEVYGIDDIVTDMVFNTVGGVVVAVAGTGYFDGTVAFLRRQLARSD